MAVAITPIVGAELQKCGLNVLPIHPGNGIDIVTTSGILKIYDACYIANPLHVEKGLIDVIHIWRLVTREIPQSKLIIAGRIDRKSEEMLRALIHRYSLDKNIIIYVSMAGLPHNLVRSLMAQCKLFVYPTRKDVWPLVIGEAMSVGMPVVAYALPDIRYAYGECRAVKLVEVGDIVKAAREVIGILQNREYVTLSKLAREFAQKMTWERVALLEAKAILEGMKSFYQLKVELDNRIHESNYVY
jgi:glycosyltransferase involved in cell wall biosynthesis